MNTLQTAPSLDHQGLSAKIVGALGLGTHSTLKVLQHIIDHREPGTTACFHSIPEISRQVGVSTTTVQNTISRALEVGLLTRPENKQSFLIIHDRLINADDRAKINERQYRLDQYNQWLSKAAL